MSKLLAALAAMIAVSASGFSENEEISANSTKQVTIQTTKNKQKAPFFEQGMYLKNDKVQKNDLYPAAYNAAACVSVDNSWDLNASVSYIYWYSNQDAMDLAFVQPTLAAPGAVAYQNNEYKSGFKVGLGMDSGQDGWTTSAMYTWVRNNVSQSGLAAPVGTWTASNWQTTADPFKGASLASEWKMHMDLLDVIAGRPFYQGRAITISPSGGLRALWLRQEENITLSGGSVGANSNSWALGLVGNANSHVMIWKGLRVDSLMGMSLLYTNYTHISSSDTNGAGASVTTTVKNLSALRPTINMGLGLGYGAYCFSNKFYFDFAVRYDFNYFWQQNMARNYATQLQGFDDAIGDLRLHGLTVDFRCDF